MQQFSGHLLYSWSKWIYYLYKQIFRSPIPRISNIYSNNRYFLEIPEDFFLTDFAFRIGPTMLIGMIAGFLISGYFISKYKPGPKYLLGWNVLVGLVFALGEFIFMHIDCVVKDIEPFSKHIGK